MRRCFRGEVVRSTMAGVGGTQRLGHYVVEVEEPQHPSSQLPNVEFGNWKRVRSRGTRPASRPCRLGSAKRTGTVGSFLSLPRAAFLVLLTLREALRAFGLDLLHL